MNDNTTDKKEKEINLIYYQDFIFRFLSSFHFGIHFNIFFFLSIVSETFLFDYYDQNVIFVFNWFFYLPSYVVDLTKWSERVSLLRIYVPYFFKVPRVLKLNESKEYIDRFLSKFVFVRTHQKTNSKSSFNSQNPSIIHLFISKLHKTISNCNPSISKLIKNEKVK